MVNNISPSQWICTGKSVQGAAHIRSKPELPNQDAIKWHPKSGTGVPLILAVSDGHGSAKSFRSHLGSKFAVETAIEVIQEEFFSSEPSGDITPSSRVKNIKYWAEILLPRKLTERWKKKVRVNIEEHPFTNEEKETLSNKEGKKGLNSIEANPLLVYGSTLLVVVITEYFILYLQLGDGDILRVDDKGNATRPLPRNSELIGNETTSLCMPKASEQFESEIEGRNPYKSEPALIILSTDGYFNSYASDDEFFKIGRNYLQEIRESGIDSVEQQLEELLKEISSGGSGDDITIGLIFKQPDEPKDLDISDSQKNIVQEKNKDGDELIEVDEKRLQEKTVRNNQDINSKLIFMISLLLAIKIIRLSSSLLGQLEKIKTNLAEEFDAIDASNRERYQKYMKTITDLEQKITNLEINQNISTESEFKTQISDKKLIGKQQDKQNK